MVSELGSIKPYGWNSNLNLTNKVSGLQAKTSDSCVEHEKLICEQLSYFVIDYEKPLTAPLRRNISNWTNKILDLISKLNLAFQIKRFQIIRKSVSIQSREIPAQRGFKMFSHEKQSSQQLW